MWKIFQSKARAPQKVTIGRFEIEQNGEVAYLEYSLAGNILELIHTEVPPPLRHLGIASQLAETGLRWAQERNLKVDVVCPLVQRYVDAHPEYAPLILT
jgi:predicted GNAT family acetyltransferase